MRLVDTVFCVDCLSPGALRRIPQKTSVFVYIVYPQYQGKLCPSLCLFYWGKGILEVMTTDGFILCSQWRLTSPPLQLYEGSLICWSKVILTSVKNWVNGDTQEIGGWKSCSLCLEIYLAAPLHV